MKSLFPVMMESNNPISNPKSDPEICKKLIEQVLKLHNKQGVFPYIHFDYKNEG